MLTNAPNARDRWGAALVIGASLLLAAVLLAFGLLLAAIQQRLMDPPRFALHLGHLYLSAPCPKPGTDCDVHLNYYAIWRGADRPDGSVQHDELFFTYLPKQR